MCDSIITGNDGSNATSVGSNSDDDDSETSAQRHFRESQLINETESTNAIWGGQVTCRWRR